MPEQLEGHLASHVLELVAASAGSANHRWVHILPEGTFETRDGRGPFSVDNAEAVIAASLAAAGKTRIVVDYEHQTINSSKNGQPNPAAGWIVAMERRKGGIWALVEFTQRAANHITAREYRYISPVFSASKEGKVGRIANVALTNTPALAGDLVPLSKKEQTMTFDTARLRAKLGLGADADEDAIFQALDERLAATHEAASVDLTKYAPVDLLEKAVAEANSLRQGMTLEAATRHVETAIKDGKVPPYLKEWAIEACSVNAQVFENFAASVAPTFKHILEPQGRGSTAPEITAQADEAELEVCRNLGISHESFKAAGQPH